MPRCCRDTAISSAVAVILHWPFTPSELTLGSAPASRSIRTISRFSSSTAVCKAAETDWPRPPVPGLRFESKSGRRV